MGRNRGQGNQGGDKKKKDGGEKVKIRRYKAWNWPVNVKSNLLREAIKAEKKLEKLLVRGKEGKPGGILPGSEREEALSCHISELKAQARNRY